jgi:hypothetical protein
MCNNKRVSLENAWRKDHLSFVIKSLLNLNPGCGSSIEMVASWPVPMLPQKTRLVTEKETIVFSVEKARYALQKINHDFESVSRQYPLSLSY